MLLERKRIVHVAMLITRKAPTTASQVAYAGVAAMDSHGEIHMKKEFGRWKAARLFGEALGLA